MSTLFITHESFLKHDMGPGHPESPDRLRAVGKALDHETFAPLKRIEAPWRDDVEATIELAHRRGYIDKIRNAAPKKGGDIVQLDPDTAMSPGSWEAAMRAVSAGMEAVDKVVAGEVVNAFCAIRPCGHHAETAKAMGFCLFNNIAVTGKYARKKHGLERIAVVDFDVHHGNGTQDIYWNDKDLFFASTHQMPLYPGTGALAETGAGNIFNAPLRPGDGGEKFRAAFESRILPALRAFRPDIVLISAGFDAHAADPLANLQLVENDFAWATGKLADVADKYSARRIVSMMEGGYNLEALANSVSVHVEMLMQAGS